MRAFLCAVAAGLGGLAGCADAPETSGAQSAFFDRLSSLCGKAFAGQLVSDDPADADWASQPMVMHVRDCEADVVRIPLHVGEDRSRTWVVSRTDTGLSLDHHHLHKDGSPDAVTLYGGATAGMGTEQRQEFPVNDYSKDLFAREGLEVSMTNTWAMEVVPGTMFAYELSRENRFFRAEFDLTTPVEAPPAAWGYDAD